MTEPAPKPAEVAEWMWKQLQEKQYLDRETATDQVSQLFGEQFIEYTEGGTAKVKASILGRFRKLYGSQAYYEGKGQDGGWTMVRPR